jgi:hypothetical protein
MTLASSKAANTPVRKLDHIIYATPDLKLGVDTLEELLGVRAIPSGQHPGHGTRKAFIRLGGKTFLVILGPDPDQPSPITPAGSGSIVCGHRGQTDGPRRNPIWTKLWRRPLPSE